jgi:6-phosphogluconolactonase
MSISIEILDDPVSACAERLVQAASRAGQIVLTGGSTPESAYVRAAHDERAWAGATLWFSDERCVPIDDPRSNYGMVKRALLDAIPEPAQPSVHRIAGELGPAAAADAYEAELQAENGAARPFELVLLGLGPDTHIASLFPGQPSLQVQDRLAVGVETAGHEPFVPRVSLTLPALAAAERIVFLVTGESKAEAVARAFGGGATPDPSVPATMLVPLHDGIDVLLDREAASQL